MAAALREFREETGIEISGNFISLSPVKQKSGKTIFAFALEKDVDSAQIHSNSFEMEWPPHSGKMQEFPEVDRAGWFFVSEAREKLNPAQVALIDEWMNLSFR